MSTRVVIVIAFALIACVAIFVHPIFAITLLAAIPLVATIIDDRRARKLSRFSSDDSRGVNAPASPVQRGRGAPSP